MNWKDTLKKEDSAVLDTLPDKKRKQLKKTLQAAQPTEYFGQDFTKLGQLIDMVKELDLIKSDKKLTKKVKTFSEKNVDVVATATKLRKTYEELYRQIREIVYPKSKGLKKK